MKETLESRGAKVTYVECYRRVRPESDPRPLLAAADRGELHALSVLSAETLENFVALVGVEGVARMRGLTLVVPHEALALAADARRFARVVVAPHGAQSIVEALAPLRTGP